eukprot:3811260-Rhodomonas_salina.1
MGNGVQLVTHFSAAEFAHWCAPSLSPYPYLRARTHVAPTCCTVSVYPYLPTRMYCAYLRTCVSADACLCYWERGTELRYAATRFLTRDNVVYCYVVE